jgi:hypothetical protein
MDDLNAQLLTFAGQAQTTLGIIAIFMLIFAALGVVYFLVARASMGVFPGLYAPISGDWFKITGIAWLVGTAVFGGLYLAITNAIGAGGFTGAGG